MAGAADPDQHERGAGEIAEWRDELEALMAVATALEPLPADARERVLAWAIARWGMPRG